MKQSLTSHFQRCTTLMQRQNNVTQRQNNVDTTFYQRCFNLASTLVKAILNPVRLVMIIDL